jgi:hypothetical protein
MKKKKIKSYPLTHQYGIISIENADLLATMMLRGNLGVQIASDGRVWVCIDGVAFLRFKPLEEKGELEDGKAL